MQLGVVHKYLFVLLFLIFLFCYVYMHMTYPGVELISNTSINHQLIRTLRC